MDRSDIWVLDVLNGFLPEKTMDLLQEQIQNPQTALQAVWEHTASAAAKVTALLSPVFAPLLARALQALHDSPDVVVIGFLLAFFVFALQLIAWVHRTMMYFTRLAFRLLGWALVAALVAFVWRRGPEATIRDAVVVVSKIAGYASFVKDVWWSEYQKFDAQTKRGGNPGQRAPSGGYSRPGTAGW